jgi:hypothetical protein
MAGRPGDRRDVAGAALERQRGDLTRAPAVVGVHVGKQRVAAERPPGQHAGHAPALERLWNPVVAVQRNEQHTVHVAARCVVLEPAYLLIRAGDGERQLLAGLGQHRMSAAQQRGEVPVGEQPLVAFVHQQRDRVAASSDQRPRCPVRRVGNLAGRAQHSLAGLLADVRRSGENAARGGP